MFTLSNLFLSLLIISSCVILYQDFKERLVSLWIIVVFGILCIFSVVYFRDFQTLVFNCLSTVAYMGFTWLMLKLYLYLKFKKNKPILNELIGWADVLIILFIGLTFNGVGLVFFFCFGFIFSLISYVCYTLLNKKSTNEHIPLAGLLVVFYILSIIILHYIQPVYLIDCSFVNYE